MSLSRNKISCNSTPQQSFRIIPEHCYEPEGLALNIFCLELPVLKMSILNIFLLPPTLLLSTRP